MGSTGSWTSGAGTARASTVARCRSSASGPATSSSSATLASASAARPRRTRMPARAGRGHPEMPDPPGRRVVILVLDGVGIGSAPDGDRFGDAGAATLPHVDAATGGLVLPNLEAWGVGHL